jgi:hypothetical protein
MASPDQHGGGGNSSGLSPEVVLGEAEAAPDLGDCRQSRGRARRRDGAGPRAAIGGGARARVRPGKQGIDAAGKPGAAHQRAEHAAGKARALKAAAVDDHQAPDQLGPPDRQSRGHVTADRVANQDGAGGRERVEELPGDLS